MQLRFKFAAALVLAGTAITAHAQFKPEEAIQYRQGVMKAQRWNLVPMAMMVQGKMPFDQAVFLTKAQRLNALSSMTADGFVPGSESGAPTKARPEIWSNGAGFKQAADQFAAETPKLVAAAQSGNMDQIKAAFQGVVKSCDNCHDNFRSK
ncbi:MAG TPA: cytochrome c [Casimicrobiaceae bacterium]|nr:cytochrome c [Casimicrobiaceae bacterium]